MWDTSQGILIDGSVRYNRSVSTKSKDCSVNDSTTGVRNVDAELPVRLHYGVPLSMRWLLSTPMTPSS